MLSTRDIRLLGINPYIEPFLSTVEATLSHDMQQKFRRRIQIALAMAVRDSNFIQHRAKQVWFYTCK